MHDTSESVQLDQVLDVMLPLETLHRNFKLLQSLLLMTDRRAASSPATTAHLEETAPVDHHVSDIAHRELSAGLHSLLKLRLRQIRLVLFQHRSGPES